MKRNNCLSENYLLIVLMGSVLCLCQNVEVTEYKSLEVDGSFATLETISASSVLECVNACRGAASCTVVHFDNTSCSILDRESITWNNPTKKVFVNLNNPVDGEYIETVSVVL